MWHLVLSVFALQSFSAWQEPAVSWLQYGTEIVLARSSQALLQTIARSGLGLDFRGVQLGWKNFDVISDVLWDIERGFRILIKKLIT
jgi:hypothetical protein